MYCHCHRSSPIPIYVNSYGVDQTTPNFRNDIAQLSRVSLCFRFHVSCFFSKRVRPKCNCGQKRTLLLQLSAVLDLTGSAFLKLTSLGWWSGIVVSALASINEVHQCRARLVLRQVTVSGFNSRCRTLISVCNQPATQGQLSLPSFRGR